MLVKLQKTTYIFFKLIYEAFKKMNNTVYSQVSSKPQKFTIVNNEPQIFIPVIPTEGLGKPELTQPTPQQLSYSVITAGPQNLQKKSNETQGLCPPMHQTREIQVPSVLLAPISF